MPDLPPDPPVIYQIALAVAGAALAGGLIFLLLFVLAAH